MQVGLHQIFKTFEPPCVHLHSTLQAATALLAMGSADGHNTEMAHEPAAATELALQAALTAAAMIQQQAQPRPLRRQR